MQGDVTPVKCSSSTATGPAYSLVFREIYMNSGTQPPELARHIAAASNAHPVPSLRSAHARSSLHPERHDPHRFYSTIPCIENRRCAPRGQRSPQVPAAEAKRNARDPSWYAMRARLGPSACAAVSRARVISAPLPCRSLGLSPVSCHRQQRP